MMTSRFIIVMGVAGCGKTAVGKTLARYWGWKFYDADDFHPPENIAKMTNGIPLNDSDRALWLASLHHLISSCLKAKHSGVLACSALKERYRQQLLEGNQGLQIVYLKGNYDLIWSRLSARQDHYMKPHMLQSQFVALEEPTNALSIDVAVPVDEVIQTILKYMEN
jgi:gluconokinase